jgi:anti-sigma B factor antagonist
MDITQKELENGILMLSLKGSLDVAGAGVADSVLSGLSSDKIIADLTGVDFVASAGIRVLVKTAKALGCRGGKFALMNPDDQARRVMFTTGLDKIIPLTNSEQEAIAAVS